MTITRKPKNSRLAYFLVAVVAAMAGFSVYHFDLSHLPPPSNARPNPLTSKSSELVGRQRPEFSLTDLQGQAHSITQWDGRVVLVNFWATWCPPCRKEIPAFMDVLNRYRDRGFQIVGIAIDKPKAVTDFINNLGVNYPQLIGEQDAIEVSQLYGNHYEALPYSVLFDRQGIIRFVKPGELKPNTLESQLRKWL
jgi:peroxiredoxin